MGDRLSEATKWITKIQDSFPDPFLADAYGDVVEMNYQRLLYDIELLYPEVCAWE
jgi:hypothetical protein